MEEDLQSDSSSSHIFQILFWIIFVITIGLGSTVAYLLNQNTKLSHDLLSLKLMVDSSGPIVPTPTPAEITAQTAQIPGWKYYATEDFSFQYQPDTYEVFDTVKDTTALKTTREYSVGIPNSDSILFTLYVYPSQKTAADWWKTEGVEKYNQLVKDFYDASQPQPASLDLPKFTLSTTLIGGEAGIVASGTVNSAQRGESTISVISHKGKIYLFDQFNQTRGSKSFEVGKTTLSTFSFLK